MSFELAEKRLSADTVSFTTATSSVKKGETLKDTVRNIEAMKIDMIVIRHQSSGVPYFLTRFSDACIVNAGDGQHEHPTQGLLDLYTIWTKYKKIKGLRVVLMGDAKHSRVIRSNIWGLTKLGASVAVCGPPTLLPVELEKMGVEVYTDIDKALDGADVVNVMRIQLERQTSGLLPSLREYTTLFGITQRTSETSQQELHDHASGTHQSRYRTGRRCRRQRQLGYSGAGYQRRRRADGGALSSGSKRGQECQTRLN